MQIFILTMVLMTGTMHDTEAVSIHTQEYNSLEKCVEARKSFEKVEKGHWRVFSFCKEK